MSTVTGTVKFDRYQSADEPRNTWNQDRYIYRVTLRHEGRTMRTTYYTGTGITSDSVTVADVVETLAMDAAIVQNDELGEYDMSDTMQRAIIRQTERFAYLMGDSYLSTVFPEEVAV